MAGVNPPTICDATCWANTCTFAWANTCTFAKFYLLDSVTNSDAEFCRRVLMLAGSSTPAPHQWGGVPHTPETPIPPVEEWKFNPDPFPLQ